MPRFCAALPSAPAGPLPPTQRTRRFAPVLALVATALLVTGSGHALTLGEMTPAAAAKGGDVEPAASGLDPLELYTLTVAGASATITLVETNRLRFIVPSGASSGPVALAAAASPADVFAAPFELTVVRPLALAFDPALGAAVAGYIVGSPIGDGSGPGPNFSVDVPLGRVAFVIGAGSPTRSLLLQVVTDATASAELGAQSTAVALVFTTATVLATTRAEADARLASLEAQPETAALAAVASNALAAGRDYLDDPAFSGRLFAAIRAFEVAQAAPARLQFASSGLFGEDYVRGAHRFVPGHPFDLPEPAGLGLLNRLDVVATGAGTGASGVPTLGMKWDATATQLIDVPVLGPVSMQINPVDWIAHAYQLDPFQFPGGIDDVNALVADGTAYTRLEARAVDHLVIASKDPTRFIDVGSTLIGLLAKRLEPDSDLRVRADHAGLYMVRAMSGAHYPGQDALLAALPDGELQSSRALALNLFIATLDTVGLFNSQLGGKNRKDFVRIGFDVYLTMERIVEEKSRSGALSADDMLAIRYSPRSAHSPRCEGAAPDRSQSRAVSFAETCSRSCHVCG